MLKDGGLDEIFEVFDLFTQKTPEPLDFEKGLLQAIGYKEFYPFYTQMKASHQDGVQELLKDWTLMSDKERDLLKECRDRLQLRTMQYTIQQVKWLSKRLSKTFTGHSEYPDLLLQIKLDNPQDYEAKALSQALAFIKERQQWYREVMREPQLFKETYSNEKRLAKALKM